MKKEPVRMVYFITTPKNSYKKTGACSGFFYFITDQLFLKNNMLIGSRIGLLGPVNPQNIIGKL